MPNNAHLSLFSGIGGLDLAAEWAGFKTVAFVERDKYCQRVLAKHWPGVPIYGDVCEVTADTINIGRGIIGAVGEPSKTESGAGHQPSREVGDIHSEALSILSGGFPCQPHSVAGKRKASLDERDLWSECARITGEFRPRWAVFENVPGLLSSEGGTFFARVLGDLAALGYRVGWGVWGANDVGALHKRDRVFIVAHAGCNGGESERGAGIDCGPPRSREGNGEQRQRVRAESTNGREDVADAGCEGLQGAGDERGSARVEATGQPLFGGSRSRGVGGAQSGLGRGFDGIPGWLDGTFERGIPRVSQGVPQRVQRLRALGNAVVPQQAFVLFKAIAEIEGING